MTDTPLTAPENALVTEDVLDLDEWLSTGTLARRAVPIHNDPALVAEYDVLAQQLAEAEAAEEAGAELSAGEKSPVRRVQQQIEALFARWEASRATWIVRALTEDEIAEINERHPDPAIPSLLGGEKPALGTPEHDERIRVGQEFVAAREKVVNDRNLATIAAAVVEVRTARGVARRVTVEQIRRLRARPHGKTQTQLLLDAIASATTGEVEIPRPTWPGRSDSDRG